MRTIKNLVICAAFSLAAALTGHSLAQEGHGHGHHHGPMGENMAKGMMHQKCGGMGKGCGGDMVATSDGGVVVKCGQELIKYDRNLKLVKQVQIECSCCAKKDSAMGDSANCHKENKGDKGDKETKEKVEKPAAPAKK